VTSSFLNSNDTTDTTKQNKIDEPLSTWRQLTLNIKGQPKNFQLHTQRIMLAMNIRLQPYLPGALNDFFLSIETAGRPLREKMFRLVSPLLETTQREYFSQWLSEDSDANLECAYYPGAVFSSNNCQKPPTDDDEVDDASLLDNFLNENYNNVIDKAHYCIAYGNIDHAQKLLELELTLIHKGKQFSKIEQELLNLYYHTKNKQALEAMSQNMLASNKQLSTEWKQVQNAAKEW